MSNNHLWSSSFKKYHRFSVFSVFIFGPILTFWAISQLLGSAEKSHINNLFLYWPQVTFLTIWILTCPGYVNLLRNGLLSTVSKIYTPIFSFFQKRVVNIVIWELGPVSNERPGNFTVYGGIRKFLNSSIFEKITDL